MKTGTILQPESLQAIATAMAQERTLEAVLQTIVNPLGACPTIALARIWLIERGDICASCKKGSLNESARSIRGAWMYA